MRTRSAAGERGQATVEYAGLIALLAALLAALLSLGIATGLAGELGAAVCRAAGFCDGRAGSVARPTRLEAFTHLREAPLGEFLAERDSGDRDPRLDWSSDSCSSPIGDEGWSFDFTEACLRHDFGYRNATLLGRFDALRAEIDLRFQADMLDHCEQRSLLTQSSCRRWANRYWLAVRVAGGSAGGG